MRGFTVWFTGLPCSGKTTLARGLGLRLADRGRPFAHLDGDEVRRRVSRDLGFSRADRDEHVRRVGFVAEAVTVGGGLAVVSMISPYRETRDEVRREIGRFAEVYVECPLEECIRRDVKGLYKRALAREIPQFTGISDPYEPPLNPEVTVHTSRVGVEECIGEIVASLERLGYLPQEGEFPAGKRGHKEHARP